MILILSIKLKCDNIIRKEVDNMEEKYNDLIRKINEKIDEIEDKLHLLDMIDKWEDKTRLAYELRTQELNDLKDILKE